MKNYYNNIQPIQLTIGDLVWLEDNAHHKLGNLRIGPFKVIKIDETNATIQELKTPKNAQTVHKNRL